VNISLENRVAIVIGGAAGIGAATARSMAAAGAAVAVVDIDGKGAEAVAASIRAQGQVARSYAADFGNEQQVEDAVHAVVTDFGGVDILHNNAAVSRRLVPDGTIDRMKTEWWDGTFAVNLRGPMVATRTALPFMLERSGGSIVNTSSAVSFLATGQLFAYSSAKAALNQLTVNVAALFGRWNIRCNAVAPGSVVTKRGMSSLNERTFAAIARETVLPHIAVPDDVANLVVFLASSAAASITGQVVAVDGGLTCHSGAWADLMYELHGERFDAAAASWSDALEVLDRLQDGLSSDA
jgi:NAD(P)-dependent dehydrogenase (short-subunit alcohol dehydrogenase family)